MKNRLFSWLSSPWFWAILCWALLNRHLVSSVPIYIDLQQQDADLPWSQIVLDGLITQLPALITSLLIVPLALRQSTWRVSLWCAILFALLTCLVVGIMFMLRGDPSFTFGDWARNWFSDRYTLQALIIIACCSGALFFSRAQAYR
ncbi:hypothetical protein CIG19_01990 [Enterobacterales bacterium CwR94]|nr:hypothetical protein CIG19_01990 [Enterobacterales bacterium CwR94]